MKAKHLVSVSDLTKEDILEIFEWSELLKQRLEMGVQEHALAGKALGMIFEKSSMRTRISFEVAIQQLGGYAIFDSGNFGLGEREAIKDVGKVMSRHVDGIVIRTFHQKNVKELARHSSIPIINGLSDSLHPCQALADVFTVKEKFGSLDGIRIAFIGDGNNVARSLAIACAKLGLKFTIATPRGHELETRLTERLKKAAGKNGFSIRQVRDPKKAVQNAQIIYTDVWTSMGQEAEAKNRLEIFKPFQVNQDLLAAAPGEALVMHCLPAHRGDEITNEVIDGPASIVYDQAENRLHVQKAILRLLMGAE